MFHVVLLGDSIFDNSRYVPGQTPVIEQLRHILPPGSKATLLAVDGHETCHVAGQLRHLPADATHLFVSVGGNDALGKINLLMQPVVSVGAALALLRTVLDRFRSNYQKMLQAVLAFGKPTTVCTIYDSIPGLEDTAQTALGGFNEVILRLAFQAVLPVIDLRLVCTQPGDYSHVSAIEPSSVGGAKIARLIAQVTTGHDFFRGRSEVYC